MKSPLPKVLHEVCGRPLVYFPVRAALDVGAERVVVVVNPAALDPMKGALDGHLAEQKPTFALQHVARGTGDAARAGMSELSCEDEDSVLILSGDTPLLTGAHLQPLLEAMTAGVGLAFMFFRAHDPTGYGRVLRNGEGMPTRIVEHRDLEAPEEFAVRDVNAGVYLVRAGALKSALLQLECNNAQGEYYLTDIVASIARQARTVAVEADEQVLAGVNDRGQLNQVERVLFERIRHGWGKRGVSIVGEAWIDDTVVLGQNVRLETAVRLRGKTTVGAHTLVDVGTVLQDARIGENAVVKPYCVVTDSSVGNGVQLGPFAHLRPGSVLDDDAHVGNFVETKSSHIKSGAKANHLAYIGDAEIGERANLGAGTIICNYDGFAKRRTVIGPGAFIGSDSQLIAPVVVGSDAYVGTGTTVTQDVPDGAVAIGRVRQTNKLGYAAPLRQRLREQAEADKAKRSSPHAKK